MSPRAAAEFTRQWPALERRLYSFLANKGVPTSDLDDLVQETATRLLSVWRKVDRTRESWPLVVTIALNLLRDRGRKRIFEILGDLPEMPTADASEAGIARVELGEVLRAMDQLTPSQRDALLRALEPPRDAMTTDAADKMLRLRARRRLANVVGRASAGIALRLRKTSDGLHAFFAKGDGIVQALACATCLFVTTAGAASLAPGFAGTDRNAATAGVTLDGASLDSSVATSDLNHSSLGAEVLRPDRNDYASAGGGAEEFARGPSRAGTTGGSETDAGSTVGLPGNAPIPSGDDLPAPPSTPDAPEGPPEMEVQGDLPEPPSTGLPTPSTEEVVEEVTGTVGKVTR
jgi:hypothetical protein